MNIPPDFILFILSIISGIGGYMFRRNENRINKLDRQIAAKANAEDVHNLIEDKYTAIIREIDDKRDRIRALELKLDRIMELLLEIKNGKK